MSLRNYVFNVRQSEKHMFLSGCRKICARLQKVGVKRCDDVLWHHLYSQSGIKLTLKLVLWSTQRLSTFMSTQRISWHVDITFNISTKERWKIKCQWSCEKLQWAMQLLIKSKNETSLGPKRRIITNWEPYFIVYFQITLVSQRHSPVLVKKHAHFMLMSSPSAHACATQDASVWLQLLAAPLTKWNLPVPCKLGRETRCVLQNWNGIFPTSELSFTRGFMNELTTDDE